MKNPPSYFVIFMLISGCAQYRTMDVNSILNSGYLDGDAVRVKSCFISGRHGMALMDCTNPNSVISVEFSNEVISSGKGKELLDLGYGQWPPKSKVEIEVDVIGVVKEKGVDGRGAKFFVTKINSIASKEDLNKPTQMQDKSL